MNSCFALSCTDSLQRNVMIEPPVRTTGGDPAPDTDFGSLFHLLHHRGIADFSRFISISRTVNEVSNESATVLERSSRYLDSKPD